jgi:hypothetical protein
MTAASIGTIGSNLLDQMSRVPGTEPTLQPGPERRPESQPSSQYEQRETNDRSE